MKPEMRLIAVTSEYVDSESKHVVVFAISRKTNEMNFIGVAEEFGAAQRIVGDGRTYDKVQLKIHPLYKADEVVKYLLEGNYANP